MVQQKKFNAGGGGCSVVRCSGSKLCAYQVNRVQAGWPNFSKDSDFFSKSLKTNLEGNFRLNCPFKLGLFLALQGLRVRLSTFISKNQRSQLFTCKSNLDYNQTNAMELHIHQILIQCIRVFLPPIRL